MRIYPDPELPDIQLDVSADCESASEILINLVAVDDGTLTEHVLPCTDQQRIMLEDIPRKLYRVDGALLGADGGILSTTSGEVDLRNGFDEEAYIYFDSSPYLRVGWDFEGGASCASLGVDTVAVDFDFPEDGYGYSIELSCGFGEFLGYPYGSMISFQLRGISRRKTVAASVRTSVYTLDPSDGLSDIGTLTLLPCGDGCPSGPEPF